MLFVHDLRSIMLKKKIFLPPQKTYGISTLSKATRLFFWDLDLAGADIVGYGLWRSAIDLAAGGESSAEDLQNGTLEILGHGLVSHGPGNGNDLVERDGLGVLDVLLLLAVSRWLLKGLDDERRGRWDDRDGGLTVLDGQANGDTETFLYEGR